MHRSFLGALLLIGFTASTVAADSPNSGPDSRIATLIKQLGSSRFSEREKAGRELEAVGEPALAALRQATRSPDLEISRRAGDILRKVEEKAAAARVLAPKRVRLVLKDVPVADAVKQLEKQSGYGIRIQGTPEERKITLDTGDTTFWQALDRLCLAAGLREVRSTMPMMPGQPPGIFNPIRQPQLPGGILPVPPPPAPPKKAPVLQVQAPVPLQPLLPAMPFGGKFSGASAVAGGAFVILAPDKSPLPPTCYAGSARIRLVSRTRARPGEIDLALEVAAEPRVSGFNLDGSPRLEKALDNRGRKLEPIADSQPQKRGVMMVMPNMAMPNMPMQAMMMGNPMMGRMALRPVAIRLKLADEETKALKELTGSLAAKALSAAEPLVTVADVLHAAGKTVKGANDAAIQVQTIEQLQNGEYQVKLRLENAGGVGGQMMMMGGGPAQMQMQMQMQVRIAGNIGGNVMIGGAAPMANRMPALLDKDGTPYRLAGMPSMRMNLANGRMSQELTLVFHATDGQGPPDRLVYSGQRVVNVTVPFRFSDIPF